MFVLANSTLIVLCTLDVLSNRKLLGMLLAKKGIQSIIQAEDGLVATKLVETSLKPESTITYDIIFMDNTMPNMVSSRLTLRYTVN